MARAHVALEKAIKEILAKHGANGRPLSLRQAERLTGLSPATIGELAKGNARTAETVRRFAVGMGEEPTMLLIMAGFEPKTAPDLPTPGITEPLDFHALSFNERSALTRFESALAQLPPGPVRALFVRRLCDDVDLIERFVAQTYPENSSRLP